MVLGRPTSCVRWSSSVRSFAQAPQTPFAFLGTTRQSDERCGRPEEDSRSSCTSRFLRKLSHVRCAAQGTSSPPPVMCNLNCPWGSLVQSRPKKSGSSVSLSLSRALREPSESRSMGIMYLPNLETTHRSRGYSYPHPAGVMSRSSRGLQNRRPELMRPESRRRSRLWCHTTRTLSVTCFDCSTGSGISHHGHGICETPSRLLV